MNLKAWGRIGGLFGMVVLFSAVFNWLFVTGSIASAGVIVRLLLGFAGIAFWLVTNRGEHPLGRGAFYGTVSAVSGLVLVALLVAVNYIAVKKPQSWDLTKDRIFTLSDQTAGGLKGLKVEVKVQAFYSAAEPEYTDLDQRLRQYRSQTDKLQVEFVDPLKRPGLVKEMNISQSGPRVVIRSGSKEARAKDTSEESLTNALIEVTRGSTKKVYFAKGHGENARDRTASASAARAAPASVSRHSASASAAQATETTTLLSAERGRSPSRLACARRDGLASNDFSSLTSARSQGREIHPWPARGAGSSKTGTFTDEEALPAQEASTDENTRLPAADGYTGWPERPVGPPA